MLNSTYAHIAGCHHSTTLGVDNFLRYCLDNRLPLYIYTLYTITRILWSGIKSYRQVQACMKSLSKERETTLQGSLLC